MTSRIQIYNIALNTLGISTPVENINIKDNKIILLNNYYDLAKDYVLRDFDWNFASTFRELSLKSSENIGEYKYSYNYPNNCLCARNIFQKDNFVLQKFIVSTLIDEEKVILTNVEKPILRYTRRIDREIYFPSEFSMALSYYLAALTANVLTGNNQKGELAYEKYKSVLKHAKMLNAQEGADYIYEDTTYLDARG